jgi:hypothetical protein
MADTPLLVATDNLVTAFPKINASIGNANLAKQIQDGVQEQIDVLVVSGDSSPESAQARVEADGTTNVTLKARLDKKEALFTTQLADIATFNNYSTVLTKDTNGNIIKTELKDGTIVIQTTNITRDSSGNVTSVQDIANGRTVTTSINRTSDGTVSSTSKAVV